ncbi:ATP-binding protein [Actinomadura decatromicini]|uniref:ATP-binding protein n=1 Tax=Actinomadura decatromicini TaxID=2604572 RepID=A0A5D3FLF1_9ACTN|nr:ATP-binding protein [Actinomadura decatromicini]TYK49063.1 ATP-binding protein [Actinomadura decatromicini]
MNEPRPQSGRLSTKNPLRLERYADRPPLALEPHRVKEHKEHYVDTRSFKSCFDEFKEEFSDLEMIRDRGHLVYVHGAHGTGKTSLICRCAHYLKELSTPAEVRVVDARSLVGPTGTPQRRMLGLALRICWELLASQHFRDDQNRKQQVQNVISDIERLKGDRTLTPDMIRAEISTMLFEIDLASVRGGPLVVVILPRSTNLADVCLYADVVQPCMLFFTEIQDEDLDKDEPPFHGNISVIQLHTRSLEVEDGWAFIRKRLSGKTDGQESWKIQEDDITRIMTAYEGRMTIRMLVDGLVDLFEQIIGTDSSRDVSYSDLESQFIVARGSRERAPHDR